MKHITAYSVLIVCIVFLVFRLYYCEAKPPIHDRGEKGYASDADPEKDRLLQKLLKDLESRPDLGDSKMAVSCYLHPNNRGIIQEIKFKTDTGFDTYTKKMQEDGMNRLYTFLANNFVVGEIREYGKHDITFTVKGVSVDGEILFLYTARFSEVLQHAGGHPW